MEIELTKNEKNQLEKEIRDRRRTERKTSIAKHAALKHSNHNHRLPGQSAVHYVRRSDRIPREELTNEHKFAQIDKQVKALSALPKASKYAQHMLKVLRKARELLEEGCVCFLFLFLLMQGLLLNIYLCVCVCVYRSTRTSEQQQELDRLLNQLSLS